MTLANADQEGMRSAQQPPAPDAISGAVDRFGIPVELACSAGQHSFLRRLLGRWQAVWLAMLGPRWHLLPLRVRRVIRSSPIGARAGRRVVRSMRSLDDWHLVWVDYAQRSATQTDVRAEVAALGFARLALGGWGDPRERVIVERLRALYLERGDLGHIERVLIEASGTAAQGLVQIPGGVPPAGSWPVVLVQAGIGEPKERIHRLATLAVARGFACVRVDMPDVAASTAPGLAGVVEAAIDAVESDPRLDGGNLHLFGSCFAGAMVLDGALRRPRVRSVTAISSWYHYEPGSGLLPTSLLEYVLAGMPAERDETGRVVSLPDGLSLRGTLGALTCPVRLYHGALDQVTSARETWAIAAELDPFQTDATTFLLDGHGCTRHRAQIELEFIERASEACSRRNLRDVA